MGSAVFINNKIVAPDKAFVSVFDHGFLFGDSIYEVVRTVKGKLFMWDAHIERLKASAAKLELKIPADDATLLKNTLKTLEEAGNEESYIRIIITRGAGEISLDPQKAERPDLIIIVKNYEPYNADYYQHGARVILSSVRRNHPAALDPAVKTGNYLNNIFALMEAKKFEANEAIMLNHSAYLTEATTSNLFFVSRGELCTPALSCGLLAGITRVIIAEAAKRVGVAFKEGKFRKKSLFDADEAFLSGTIKEVMPIREIYDVEDERAVRIGTGRPGAITKKLMSAWPEIVEELMKAKPASGKKQ